MKPSEVDRSIARLARGCFCFTGAMLITIAATTMARHSPLTLVVAVLYVTGLIMLLHHAWRVVSPPED